MKRRLFPVLSSLLLSLYPLTSHAQWAPDGVVLCAGVNNQFSPQAIPDGVGGAFVTWGDTRSGTSDIYAQRVNGQGVVQWLPANGVAVRVATNNQTDPRIVSDASGGAIIVWVEQRNNGSTDVYAQRIDATGAALWGVSPIIVCSATNDQQSISAIPDGAGGAIFAWQDARGGSFSVADIYAQRVNSAGVVQWITDGVAVCTAADQQSLPVLVSDGAGGAIVAWSDNRSGTNRDIYSRRVTNAGALQWTANGVAVCTAASEQDSPAIAVDAAGGAVIAWTDARNGSTDIYAQRMNGLGAAQWTPDGVAVCTAANGQNDPQIIADNGGALLLWNDARDSGTTDVDIYAQRLSASGAPQWTGDGVAVCTAINQQVFARMTPDGSGGAVAAWMDTRNGGLNYDMYAQRIKPAGTMQWPANGVALCNAANGQFNPTLASDGFGGAIVAWQDLRNGTTYDIYANRITQSGAIPTAIGSTPPAPSFLIGDAFPNPFSAETTFDVSLPRAADVRMEIFDVGGRRVRGQNLGRLTSGTRRLSFDGRGDDTRQLPSGVYFVRVRAGNETATRKLVIQR
jgi:hypothetical protein